MIEEKRKKGRPSQDKVMRPYTIDRKIAEFIDRLPDGDRSRFVNNVLAQGIAEMQKDIEGVYQYEGDIITVSIQDGNVIAQNQNGIQVPPMEVILSGHKLSGHNLSDENRKGEGIEKAN